MNLSIGIEPHNTIQKDIQIDSTKNEKLSTLEKFDQSIGKWIRGVTCHYFRRWAVQIREEQENAGV